jgi:hypothetical protein
VCRKTLGSKEMKIGYFWVVLFGKDLKGPIPVGMVSGDLVLCVNAVCKGGERFAKRWRILSLGSICIVYIGTEKKG